MGELFRQVRPGNPLAWTGERMVPGQTGAIEAEHYHRYFLAREMCRGKDVLDVASGEGYGAAFLSQTSRSVVGVELDLTAVEHATREYSASNLRFIAGEATNLPIEDHSVDAVVSFETIEHVLDHQLYLRELKRVLRPNGFAIFSTPDSNVYSALGTDSNPFHVNELTDAELRQTLAAHFRKVAFLRQRAFCGSAVLPENLPARANAFLVYEQRDSETFEADRKLIRAPFIVAVAADHALPAVGFSLYIQSRDAGEIPAEMLAEFDRLRDVEASCREQANAAARVPAMEAELDRLRQVEAAARDEAETVRRIIAESAEYRRAADALELQVQDLLRDLDSARESSSSLEAELQAERERLDMSSSLARQQSLTVQRGMLELQSVRQENLAFRQEIENRAHALENQRRNFEDCTQDLENHRRELDKYRQELESYKVAYAQIAGLLISPRMRNAVPAPLRQPFRAVKRAIRSILHR